MNKYLIITIFLSFFLFFTPLTFAQEDVEAWGFQCVPFVHCADGMAETQAERAKNQRCQPVGDDTVHKSDYWPHRSQEFLDRLTFPVGSRVIVTECIDAGVDLNDDGGNDAVCTTGDSTQDKILFCGDASNTDASCDHFGILKEKLGYNFTITTTGGVYYKINGVFQKANGMILTDENGKTKATAVEWEGHTSQEHNAHRKYIAWYYTPPAGTPTPVNASATEGSSGVGGQQQAMLTFPSSIPLPTIPPPDNDECGEGVAWDPYGRVFDMKSLEPVPQTQILLMEKNQQGVFDAEYAKAQNLMIFNPYTTGVSGSYIFFVQDGDYAITPTKDGYSHPSLASQSELLPNTTSIYSDIYFSDSPPIMQRGAIQHRDIPLMPSDGIGKKYDLTVLTEHNAVQPDGRLKYNGVVSHPFAELVVETCTNENGTEVCANSVIYNQTNGGPDKNGKFEVMLDQRLLKEGEYYGRSFRKIDLTSASLSNLDIFQKIIGSLMKFISPQEVFAEDLQTSRVPLQPVVSYLEGFAYDRNGTIMPNTDVNFYIPLSQRPVYKTKADARGYYRVTSEFLPNESYQVGYNLPSDTQKKVLLTTSQVLTQNKEFIASEKIDVYKEVTMQTNPRRTVIPSYVPLQQISPPIQKGLAVVPVSPVKRQPAIQAPVPQPQRNPMLLVGAILLLLVAAAATVIGVLHMYKKKFQNPA